MYIANPFGTSSNDPRARIFGIVPYRIPSKSMIPTLQVGDFILVKAGAYSSEIPEINDVIVFKYPENRNQDFVMRVVAREGENMTLSDGNLVVDGRDIDQSYLDLKNTIKSNSMDGSLNVPEGHLFVLGDNRDHSNDSRYWGFVPIKDVVGKVSMIWMSDDIDRIGKNVE
ncbi:MAG: signal peptidase I [Gammaproteobacteria bacterium]|nr:signal peptidase I [Gammaproteobacteria bacterium]